MSVILETVRGRALHVRTLGWLVFAGLLTGNAVGFVTANESTSQLIDRIVISAGLFVLLFGLIFRERSQVRKQKYANIQEDLHDIQHTIRNQVTILRLMEGLPPSSRHVHRFLVRQNLRECLNSFASIFTHLTGTQCRATIKMIEPGAAHDEKPVVYTLMRDSDSESAVGAEDAKRREKGQDLLEANTDFSTVFGESGQRWFFCNDLPALSSYMNSQAPNLSQRNLSGFRGALNAFWAIDWTLPYRSNIVWPIRQTAIVEEIDSEFRFVGFLTIDSPRKNAFDVKLDTYLGASVADSLYYMLVRLDEVGTTGGTDD